MRQEAGHILLSIFTLVTSPCAVGLGRLLVGRSVEARHDETAQLGLSPPGISGSRNE
ncbi:hypothetical protein KAURM247S_01981 [Kitasatospora aureofaciens]